MYCCPSRSVWPLRFAQAADRHRLLAAARVWRASALCARLDRPCCRCPLGAEAVREIALPTLLILPLATATLGVLLNDLLERDRSNRRCASAKHGCAPSPRPFPTCSWCSTRTAATGNPLRRAQPAVRRAVRCSAAACMTSCPRPRSGDFGFIQQTLNSDSPQLIEYSLPTLGGPKVFEGRALPLEQPPGRSAPWSG